MGSIEPIVTGDGSMSLYNRVIDEPYHSRHGAINESLHVFINAGLHYCQKKNLRLLEVGMGTGLNTLLTLMHHSDKSIHCTTLEPYPLEEALWSQLNYVALLGKSDADLAQLENQFKEIHQCEFQMDISFDENFTLYKSQQGILEFLQTNEELTYDLIYFDAFAPLKQEDMWTEEVFQMLYDHTNQGGILTTYCAMGLIRRRMISVGFKVEKIPGPPGKREMLRAVKA